jgi:hypothetical protein
LFGKRLSIFSSFKLAVLEIPFQWPGARST